ncbi:MAG: integrase/recombinase XerD [Cellvibrionaceae bacterium]|jgi:integrase/recombinase XerD
MQSHLNMFLKSVEEQDRYTQNTISAYKNDLGQFYQFVSENFSFTSWNDLTMADINVYINDMQEKGYASSTIARKIAAVKSFFSSLHAHQKIDQNPTQGVDSPRVQKRTPQPLSQKDVMRLLHAPRNKQTPKHLRDAALLGVLYSTGMRVTEIVSIKLNELDLKNSLLRCINSDGQTRDLPLEEETNVLLSKYLDRGRPGLIRNGNQESLFLNHRGQQLTRQGLWLIIKAYAKEAGLETPVTPHTLRHSFASHKIGNGTNLQEVQQLLGHANISTTQIYAQKSKK